jgi:hypothetical protein
VGFAEYFAFTLIISVAGYFDFKTKEVPTLLCAIAWLSVLFPPFSIAVAGYWFAAIFTAYEAYAFLKHQPLFGFGDALLLPPLIAVAYSMPLTSQALAGITLIVFSVVHVAKRGINLKNEETIPLMAWMTIAYYVALLPLLL